MLSPKELKKLAAACREAGIKHYKTADFEFTLTDDAPVKNSKRPVGQNLQSSVQNEDIESENLTDDQLLFWSSADTEKNLGN